MREVIASAPSKVNVCLYVGAPEPDGYHPLVTVFEALNLREKVTVRTSRTPGIHVRTTAYFPDGSIDHPTTRIFTEMDPRTHLAWRAAKLMQKLAMATPWAQTAAGVSIQVDKYVPVAGGMAGGSADAAATLIACQKLWDLPLQEKQLHAIARSLGADVPACLVGGLSLGTGRGDHMHVLSNHVPARHWVLALSDRGLSTPEVFRELDAGGGPLGKWQPLPAKDPEHYMFFADESEKIAPHIHNDLSEAACRLRPELTETMRSARQAGALAAFLSGSGPTIAALARDEEHALQIARTWEESPYVQRTICAHGPAQGARLESL
ncbi:4-(cytidine 5'-diphospho)-2-C-methyl-D-erythritol kinase [Schaalia sp. lx-100]|uniref:4-(cytidine 5'-diphospho)-2-C-methyl-D-erythritol kinase n=1 Tax=Schaalia sp. lx-100 TaxID=2899081 RepID=UPI001E4C241D|nr:4-(cytidine 5'-diphospho)-2-C-methyl-D-erythritol kinase [Schaalia sp. lx-100]MCD4557243.1 4-(cytidine 5'-diphospho)-2-C-methyl-D-erythritol kinase [Schaalia sp. lx-100]